MEVVEKFLRAHSIPFKNLHLYIEALTHSSYANENYKQFSSTHVSDNQRLEFLGDSVLALVINHSLYERDLNYTEGEMAQLKSILVSEATLGRIAVDLGIGSVLKLSKGELKIGGENKKSILSDALEAVFAALYLDLGFLYAQKKIIEWYKKELEKLQNPKASKDSKSSLQEYTQKHLHILPKYEEVNKVGPPHKKSYTVRVLIGVNEYARGVGTTLKSAEQEAASKALLILKKKGRLVI